MATTVAAVLVDGDVANIGHVGDSRIYLLSDDEFTQLTSDHSWVNEQIQSGVISADQARSHPLRNVVTRALGGKHGPRRGHADAQDERRGTSSSSARTGSRPWCPTRRSSACCGRPAETWRRASADLVGAANEHGGEDNITVVLLKFET